MQQDPSAQQFVLNVQDWPGCSLGALTGHLKFDFSRSEWQPFVPQLAVLCGESELQFRAWLNDCVARHARYPLNRFDIPPQFHHDDFDRVCTVVGTPWGVLLCGDRVVFNFRPFNGSLQLIFLGGQWV